MAKNESIYKFYKNQVTKNIKKYLKDEVSQEVLSGDWVEIDENEFERCSNIHSQITLKKCELAHSDYRAIKYAEGCYTEEEYAPYKAARQTLRDEINSLEESI